MTVMVFTGPTISAEDAAAHLDATYLPPAEQGDVYRAARERPLVIGIIDGSFERIPAVFHKEILWAMREGIHVFGAASMGALRAAELADFGMVGVGAVFEAYRSGELTDDDEVAVAHATKEASFAASCEAMVNIRATFAAAVTAGIVSDTTAAALVATAKALFYPDRSIATVLTATGDGREPRAEVEALAAWLPVGRVDQKRIDAIAMLQTVREFVASDPRPKQVAYPFEHTVFWEAACRDADRHLPFGTGEGAPLMDDLLDDLRLGDSFDVLRAKAVTQLLAERWARANGVRIEGEVRREAIDDFWGTRGVTAREHAVAWLQAREIDEDRMEALIKTDAYQRHAEDDLGSLLRGALLDQLLLSDQFPRLLARTREKCRSVGDRAPGMNDEPAGVEAEQLLQWWFRDRLGIPEPHDIEEYASDRGFPDQQAFIRAVARERRFLASNAAS
jgi:hypothetical protein